MKKENNLNTTWKDRLDGAFIGFCIGGLLTVFLFWISYPQIRNLMFT